MYKLNFKKSATLTAATVLHFCVDAVSAYALAWYVGESYGYEDIGRYFLLYTAWAFGTQFFLGWILDRFELSSWKALCVAWLLLGGGCLPLAVIDLQMMLLGLGNSLFHVAGGSIVLRSYSDFTSSGVFVSSGAIGLMLGLQRMLPLGLLFTLLTLCVLALLRLCAGFAWWSEQKSDVRSTPANIDLSSIGNSIWLWLCVLLLAGCVVVRGMSGSVRLQGVPLWLPCIYAAGKVLGGVVADRFGYVRSVLVILFGSFICLLFYGLLPMLAFACLSNMTMPLTLRMLHRCQPRYAGLMFGITATSLLPGVFFKDLPLSLSLLVLVQTIFLLGVGRILLYKLGRNEGWAHE